MDKDINREILKHQLGLDDINLDEYGAKTDDQSDGADENTEIIDEKDIIKNSKFDLYDLIQCIVSSVVIGIMIFILIFRVVGVKGSSMYSTLHDGDKVIVSGFMYEPKQGDIIILKSSYYSQPLVKRVIAVENQTVDIDFAQGIVYVDGMAMDEQYVYEPTYVDEGFSGPVTVPEGCVFVMGDNRNNSNDSRSPAIGFIDEREIFGKVLLLIFPTDGRDGYDWERFGLVG